MYTLMSGKTMEIYKEREYRQMKTERKNDRYTDRQTEKRHKQGETKHGQSKI